MTYSDSEYEYIESETDNSIEEEEINQFDINQEFNENTQKNSESRAS